MWCLGFRVEDGDLNPIGVVWGYRVQGAGFEVSGSEFRARIAVLSSAVLLFRIQGSGFKVQGLVFRV